MKYLVLAATLVVSGNAFAEELRDFSGVYEIQTEAAAHTCAQSIELKQSPDPYDANVLYMNSTYQRENGEAKPVQTYFRLGEEKVTKKVLRTTSLTGNLLSQKVVNKSLFGSKGLASKKLILFNNRQNGDKKVIFERFENGRVQAVCVYSGK